MISSTSVKQHPVRGFDLAQQTVCCHFWFDDCEWLSIANQRFFLRSYSSRGLSLVSCEVLICGISSFGLVRQALFYFGPQQQHIMVNPSQVEGGQVP